MSSPERSPRARVYRAPDGQAHGALQRSGIGHATLFALSYVVFQLQANRVAALVAKVGGVRVVRAALVAEHFAGMERVGDHRRSAILTSGTQVMETFQVPALALPVADRVVDKLELGHIAEVGDREHG